MANTIGTGRCRAISQNSWKDDCVCRPRNRDQTSVSFQGICGGRRPPLQIPRMRILCASLIGALLCASTHASDEFDPPRFEIALESAYLFGAINPPQDYQIAAEFITGRVRWGVVRNDNWLRGYHQFYFSLVAEPFLEGIENR